MTVKDDAIFNEKLTGGLKNYIRNLINFRTLTQTTSPELKSYQPHTT